MATQNITATLGTGLIGLLTAEDIVPGSVPSYQTCKEIYTLHPLGQKMAESPISMAQSQVRKISVPKGPEQTLVEAFAKEWAEIGADKHIFNAARLARVYGIASIALLSENASSDQPVDYAALSTEKIGFNVLDPLNTAGSLVLNQDPNSIDFLKVKGIAVGGKAYHRSRTVTVLNEEPIYIAYSVSAYGFVGRSVYQRAFYPLKSFIQTMVTDNLVSLKAGVLVAKLQSPSSAVDGIMDTLFGVKRQFIKEAEVGNVISIGADENIESLNLQNIDNSSRQARKNILDNIATAADMPATILNQETFAEGFGEGTEDAKRVAQYVDRLRVWMQPLYEYFDQVVMYRAWNPEFYKTIQSQFPEKYGKVAYTQAFYDWKNSFVAVWPNLLREPDSELIKVDDVKLKAIIAMLQVLLPECDPENRATAIQWAADNFNALKLLFSEPLFLDYEALKEYAPDMQTELKPEAPAKPFSAQDSFMGLSEAIDRLPLSPREKRALKVV